jgi:hypothetical protein
MRPTYDVSGDGLRDFFSVALNSDGTEITATISDLNQRALLDKTFSWQTPFRSPHSLYKYRGSLFISVPKEGTRYPDRI